METKTNNNYSIHCKANYNNLIRRFMFIGTEFASLREMIIKLYALNHGFVLKYIDDEQDEIMMECQRDFITAIQVTPRILRLVIKTTSTTSTTDTAVVVTPVSPIPSPTPSLFTPVNEVQKVPQCCPQTAGCTPGPEVPLCNPLYMMVPATCSPVEIPEYRKLRLETKLNSVNQALGEFGDDSKLTPCEIHRKQRLLKKQERITTCLNGTCPRQKRKALSPENALYVKQQRCLIKAEICAVKTRKRELKILLKINKDDKKLIEELTELKERSHVIKAQRRSVRCYYQ